MPRAFRILACAATLWAAAAQAVVALPPTPLVKLAVNPVTNKVYIANEFSDSVTVLDAAHGTISTVAVGTRPQFIAVNPRTNRIYVNNAGNASLTVIDGATDTNLTPTPYLIGSTGPISINTATNVVYVVRLTGPGSDEVTFFNGATNTWYTIATQSFQPTAMAVNSVSDTIFVAHYATGDVRVISGAFNPANDFPATTPIGMWSHPYAIAMNPATNKAYVLTEDARGPIGIIDGDTLTATFPLPTPGHAVNPRAVAVNPVTNRIYAAFQDEVIVIDGASGAYTYLSIGATGTGPIEIGIDYFTNKIYVAKDNGSLTLIDGDNNAVSQLSIPTGAVALGVNPLTQKVYVFGPTVTVLDGAPGTVFTPNPLVTTIDPLPDDLSDPDASIMMTAASNFTPHTPPIQKVYYQLDSTAGAWTAASGSGPFTASFTGLAPGSHTLYAFAVDGQDAPLSTGPQSIPLLGGVAAYVFTVVKPAGAISTVSLASSLNPSQERQVVVFTASVSGSAGTATGSVDFRDNGSGISGCLAVPLNNGSASCPSSALAIGTHPISASYSGDGAYQPSNSAVVTQVVNAAPPPAGPDHPTDLNGDSKSDILYRNASTGDVYRLLMNGFTVSASGYVYREPNTAWSIVADSDFNGDNIGDLLWRNATTGQVYVMPFNASGQVAGGAFVANPLPAPWKIVQTPDLDGDGKSDILWWNPSTGQVRAMLMNGATVRAQGPVYTEPDTRWKIVASGDFAGSGKRNQLLWRHDTSGALYLMTVTFANGTFSQTGRIIYTEPDTAWKVIGVADFNGDGRSDILYRNDANGRVFMLQMNDGTIAASGDVYTEPNLAWKVVAQGDYNGDGRADLLWRNETTGDVWMMIMSGFSIAVQGPVYREPNTAWKLLGPYEYAR